MLRNFVKIAEYFHPDAEQIPSAIGDWVGSSSNGEPVIRVMGFGITGPYVGGGSEKFLFCAHATARRAGALRLYRELSKSEGRFDVLNVRNGM